MRRRRRKLGAVRDVSQCEPALGLGETFEDRQSAPQALDVVGRRAGLGRCAAAARGGGEAMGERHKRSVNAAIKPQSRAIREAIANKRRSQLSVERLSKVQRSEERRVAKE